MNNPSPRPAGRPSPRPRPAPRPGARADPAAPELATSHPATPQIGDPQPPRLTFGPDYRLSIIAVPGAAFALLVVLLGSDPVQRTFSAAVVVALLAIVFGDVYFAPRLTITGTGLRVYAPFQRAMLGWHEIDTIEARATRRYGLVTTTLEISSGERLIVLDRRDLKNDPRAVLSTISEFRLTT